MADEAIVPEAFFLRIRAWPATWRRENGFFHEPTCRRNRGTGDECSQARRESQRARLPRKAFAHHHPFVVAKIAARGIALQCVAAQYHAGVDRSHDKRRHPAAEIGVMRSTFDIVLARFRDCLGRAERIGVGVFAAQRRIFCRFADDVEHAGDRPAGCRTAHRFHAHLHTHAAFAVMQHRLLLQIPDAQIRWD